MVKVAQDQEYRGNDWWDWSAWIDAPPEILSEIKRVTWKLHPTFTPSSITSSHADQNFRIQTSGWGTFVLQAEVLFRDGRVEKLDHELELFYPDGEQTTA